MTLCTTESESEPNRPHGIRSIKDITSTRDSAGSLPPFPIGHMIPMKTRRKNLLTGRVCKKIARKLLDRKLIKRNVL